MSQSARVFLSLRGPQGPIEGESRVATRKFWIELDDWNWKLEPKGKGDDAEAVIPGIFSFSKTMDRASTAMLTAMKKGDALTATVQMEEANLEQFDLNLQFERVRFTKYSLKTQGEDVHQSVDEDWECDYESITFKYRPELKAGTMELKLDRPPGSSTDSSHGPVKKLMEVAAGIPEAEREPAWRDALTELREHAAKNAKGGGANAREG